MNKFLVSCPNCTMQRSSSPIILRIHIRTVCYEQFGDFNSLVTRIGHTMQWEPSPNIFRIYFRSRIDVFLDGFNISVFARLMQFSLEEFTKCSPEK